MSRFAPRNHAITGGRQPHRTTSVQGTQLPPTTVIHGAEPPDGVVFYMILNDTSVPCARVDARPKYHRVGNRPQYLPYGPM